MYEAQGTDVHEMGESKKNQVHEVEGSAVISPDASTTPGSESTRYQNSPRYLVSPPWHLSFSKKIGYLHKEDVREVVSYFMISYIVKLM